ncbi:mechanosensitive ion channel family protein, partial [Weissella cibaria]|nr:mechanosensitive ion channel family protein [Weissella cibaria]
MDAFLSGILARLRSYFEPATLGEKLVTLAADLIVAAIVFLAFYLLWRLLN